MLGASAALAATPAVADECRIGPAPHQKGPPVFLDYDQVELDAAYENSVYEPNIGQVVRRLASQSDAARARIGEPQRLAYGIENRPGAGGNIGTEVVVNAPADGYTLLMATSVNAINATLYDRLNFNFIRDIAPVASVVPS
jgi:hypothetical protein